MDARDQRLCRSMVSGSVGSADISLNRDSKARPAPRQLLQHPYIVRSESKNVNMAKWVNALVD